MRLDPSKVNLLEKDIEEYLWRNPQDIRWSNHSGEFYVDQWLARQLEVPSGIIDLFGVLNIGCPVVVEVKNVAIDARGLAQVARYRHDIEETIEYRFGRFMPKYAAAIVVGNSIDTQAMHECVAMLVLPFVFSVNLNLSINRHSWQDEYRHQIDAKHFELSERHELFGIFDDFYAAKISATEPQEHDSESGEVEPGSVLEEIPL